MTLLAWRAPALRRDAFDALEAFQACDALNQGRRARGPAAALYFLAHRVFSATAPMVSAVNPFGPATGLSDASERFYVVGSTQDSYSHG